MWKQTYIILHREESNIQLKEQEEKHVFEWREALK